MPFLKFRHLIMPLNGKCLFAQTKSISEVYQICEVPVKNNTTKEITHRGLYLFKSTLELDYLVILIINVKHWDNL